MKITSLLINRLALLIFIILLSSSVLAETKVLMIGDSHSTMYKYGQSLHTLIKNTGAEVTSYAVGATTASQWLSNDFSESAVGKEAYLIDKNGKLTTTTNRKGLSPLKLEYTPNIIIISLGTNMVVPDDSRPSKITKAKNLAQMASNDGTKCYWIGPPKQSQTYKYKDYLQKTITELNAAVSPYCTFIDSEPLSDAAKLTDIVHYTPQGSKEWAEKAFLKLQEYGQFTNSPSSSQPTSSSSTSNKILVLGDSHYAGTYGQTLDKSLKTAGYTVESYGCVSATAEHYIDGGKHCILPQQGSTHNSAQEDYTLKPVNDYLTSIKPDTVIISLGGNIEAVSTLKFVREKQISELVKFITTKNIKCIWVGPPGKEDSDKAKERDIFYDQLKEALGNSCSLIDSRTYAQLKISDTSGHFPIGDQRAKNWAQSVFNDFKAIQGGTFSQPSPPSSSSSSPTSSSVNILHIGDSHTAISTYGTELQKLLLTTSATVNAYARSGSTPQNWLDGTTGTSFYINNNGARKSTSDSFNLKDLKSQFNPNIIIVTLGTNIISSNNLKTQSEQLAKLAVQGGTKCYWIGPPKIATDLKDKLDQAIIDINSAVSPYCTFIDSKPLSDESKLSDQIHYNNDGGKEWAQAVFKEFQSKRIVASPGKASASQLNQIPSSPKIIQSTCTNQQNCKEIDEVWASRIGAFVNLNLSNKVYAVPGGWVPFEQLYAQPKPVIATVDTYIPPTTTSKSGSCGVATYGTPEQRALLDTIASVEGGSSYNLMYCGKTFSDYSQHPYKTSAMPTPITCAGYSSTAAGRYQFLYNTYTDLKTKGYFNDFSPSEQDRAAGYLIRAVSDQEIKTAINTKNFISIWDKFATKWSSFPYSKESNYKGCTPETCGNGKSYYGQKARSDQFLKDRFFQCYEIQKNKQP